MANGKKDNWEVKEVGILTINRMPTGILYAGKEALLDNIDRITNMFSVLCKIKWLSAVIIPMLRM